MATAKDLQKAPEAAVAELASPSNCAGELVQLPQVEGVTFYEYRCAVCGALVHVGHEEREAYGVPSEHAVPDA